MNKRIALKTFAVFMALNILVETTAPSIAWALTAGPGSPDFSSFEPVATTDMVNVFSGDLTYNLPVINIPGPDGGGYAMSLSYHSGASMEEEASWVGYGWTLNPGSINRSVRGFPDDYNNTNVKYYNKTWPSWTATSQDQVTLEFFGKKNVASAAARNEEPESRFPSVSLSQVLSFNNYQGFNRMYGATVGYKGALSLGANFASGGITFSAQVDPVALMNAVKRRAKKKAEEKKQQQEPAKTEATAAAPKAQEKVTQDRSFKHAFRVKAVFSAIKKGVLSNASVSSHGLMTFEAFNSPTHVSKYSGFGFNFSLSLQVSPAQAPVGVSTGSVGSFQMQHNEYTSDVQAYGYINNLNSGDFPNDDSNVPNMMDYYMEKQNEFDTRDLFIGIPFPNYDMFSLTGEGLSGGFRMYNMSTGHYYPNYVASNTTTLNTGFEVHVGLNDGVGMSLGVGNTKFRVKNWGKTGNTSSRQYDKSAGSMIRFNQDLGGKVEYTPGTDVQTAALNVSPSFPMIKSASPSIDNNIYQYANNGASSNAALQASGRSTYTVPIIDPATNKITGFEIFKEDGSRYKYGQAVFSKNEVQISVDVDPTVNQVVDNIFVYRPTPINSSGFDDGQLENFHIVNGETKIGADAQYASVYLLTEITTTDYVDVNGNGADNADFGGWTKFDYEKTHDNYRWKIPYTGMNYEQGEISRRKDDVGMLSTGEKEIYYLRTVSTKTHKAHFITNKSKAGYTGTVTNSGVDRYDGLSADVRTDSPNRKGTDKLERLEKIILVSNARPTIPVKVVNFEYTYELIKNLPNNIYGNYPAQATNENSGKLTLKKVWFEYEGVMNARISPYEFFYRYKDQKDFSTDIQAKYSPQLNDFFALSNLYTDAAQNPSYSPYDMSPWGTHQPLAKSQSMQKRSWIWQGDIPANEAYDPAAYQLKQIKLPSGGEILIQYEEKDYRYVQDRNAMAMVSLYDFDDTQGGLFGDSYNKYPWYKVKLSDIGSDAKPADIVAEMQDYYINKGNRIFFKFLYEFSSNDIPSFTDCRSEYIEGYAKVQSVAIDPADGYLKITLNGDGSPYDGGYALTPRQGCYDFYSTHRVGNYLNTTTANGCDCGLADQYDPTVEGLAKESGTITGDMVTFLQKMGFAMDMIATMQGMVLDFEIQPPIKATVCKQLNKQLSYLKIPMLKDKRAGGCRVKRLLTYDPGIESGEAGVLYGNSYRYEMEDGTSSGVATNEPSQMRNENPLVGFLPKKNQNWLSRHTVGKDREQSEGPIGESLLPGASIGHARVVVENIHQGKTGDGFSIHTYYTVKDYAYDKTYIYTSTNGGNGVEPRYYDFVDAVGVEYSLLSDNSDHDKAPINAGIFSYNSVKYWATQGFRFIQNSMHGQPKSMETYGGKYADFISNPDKVYLVSAQVHDYFQPGEKVRMLTMNNGNVSVTWDTPGKEMDLSMEMKQLKSRTMDFGLKADITVGLSVPPPPFLTILPSFDFAENILNLHATSKVISYPVIERSTKVYQDGVWAIKENLAFDIATGQPLVTRVTDIYDHALPNCLPHDGSIYQTILPAHWYYNEMGQKSEIDGLPNLYRSNQLSASAGTLTTYGANGNPISGTAPTEAFAIPVSAVIDAKIQTFSKGALQTDWFGTEITTDYSIGSGPLAVLNNIYRPYQSYVYKTDVTSIKNNPVYDAGVYTNFTPYNFTAATQANGWIKVSEVNKYSPHGMSVEELDVLLVPSSARFGYNHTMPVAIASNCEYSTLFFEDFENNTSASALYAHTGAKSIKVQSGSQTIVPSVAITSRLKQRGAIVRLWLKTDQTLNNSLQLVIPGTGIAADPEKIAQTGAWSLYEFEFLKADLATLTAATASIALQYTLSNEQIYLDDIKFQPKDAQVSCYVYDVPTMRLTAQFDDQHFGLFYQYNDEGKLVRKMIETERGVKTVQESQYNTPKIPRTP